MEQISPMISNSGGMITIKQLVNALLSGSEESRIEQVQVKTVEIAVVVEEIMEMVMEEMMMEMVIKIVEKRKPDRLLLLGRLETRRSACSMK